MGALELLPGVHFPDSARETARAIASGLRLAPPMTVSEWADAHRRLPTKGAAEPGRWRTERTPYLRQIMDALSDHPDYAAVRRVVFMKSTQVGATEALNNWIGYCIDRLTIPVMSVQPTIDMAERWSKQRLAAMIADTPVLSAKIAPARSRDSGNTTLLKEWPGGVLVVSGANSAASLRSMPACYLAADEVDAYPVDLDGEGDPLSLAEARLDTFADRRKVFIGSTPTIASLSVVAKEYAQSDQRRYHVPCPECGHSQPLEWDHLSWPDGHPERAAYACVECGALIPEHRKTEMLAAGEWVPQHPERSAHCWGYHINALYSPIALGRSWAELAAQWDRIKSDPIKLKAFTNTRLGICTEDPEEKVDWEEIKDAAEDYGLRTIPDGCLILTAGVDVQGDRWEAQILGHGADGEQWVIDYQVIDGDPARAKDWALLEEYLREPIINANGVPLRPVMTAVDAGYLQDDVLTWTHPREHRGICATKGYSTRGRPVIGRASKVDIRRSGSTIATGAKLWMIGEDTGKSRLLHTLTHDRKAMAPAARRLHFSGELPDAYFTGLASEIWDPNKGRWIKIRARNEPLDTYVYALAASMHPRVRLHRWNAHQWERQRDAVAPRVKDLFSAGAEAEDEPEAKQPVPQRRTAPSARPQRPLIR